MYLVGIDLGGTGIKVGLVDESLKLVAKGKRKTNVELGFEQIVKDMADAVNELLDENGIKKDEVKSVGIGIPGFSNNGLATAINLFWIDVPLVAEMQKYFDVPIIVDNDANVAGLYEYHFGALKGTKVGVILTLGTGLGGGIVIDGKPFSGAHGMGAELGHIAIVPNGLPCTCGNRGCLENYATATAMIRMGRRCVLERPESMMFKLTNGDVNKVTAKMLTDCAMAGDNIAIALVDEFVGYLAMGITTIINMLDPDVIALGGGVSNTGQYLLDKVIAACAGKGVFAGQKYAEIKLAVSGNDAGLIGAAMLGK